MSWKRGDKSGRGRRSSRSSGSTSQDAPLRRWQDATGSSEGEPTRPRRSRNRWAVTTVMAIVLLTMLIVLLLYLKPRTPLIAIAATNYASPVPINAWALEDQEAFEELNGANLELPKHQPDWDESGSEFEIFPKSFDLDSYRTKVPLIVYVSAHGVVDDNGEPCLLPPGVSINKPDRWKRISKLIDEIAEKTGSKRDALLVLDCNRIRVNWSMGIIYNTFAERVKDVVDKKKGSHPKLAVLMAAGPGQVNWASPELHGSVFARYLQMGLAGAADGGESGNGDSNITLKELATYLKQEVSEWTKFNRGEAQQPMLLPEDAKDFHLTYWSSAVRALTRQFKKGAPADSHKSTEKDDELWKDLDELRDNGLVRANPAACSRYEHGLLRLEQLARGGKAYEKATERLRSALEDQIKNDIQHVRSIPSDGMCAADYYALAGDASWLRVGNVGVTLPASEYFGMCNAKDAKKVRETLEQLSSKRTLPDANAALSTLGTSAVAKLAENLSETQLFAALGQQQIDSLSWGPLLPEVLRLRTVADELAVPGATEEATKDEEPQPTKVEKTPGDEKPGNAKPLVPHTKRSLGDERAHYYTRFALDKADAQRRLVEDLLFVGRQNAPKQYDRAVKETSDLYGWTGNVMAEASTAFRLRDDAFARGPYLAQWLCSPLAPHTPEREKLVVKLGSSFESVHKLNAEINDTQSLDNSNYVTAGEDLPFVAQSKPLQEYFETLQEKTFDTDLGKLAELDVENAEASIWRQLEAALETPIIPSSTRKELLKKRHELAEKLSQEFVEEGEKGHKKEHANEHEKEPAHKGPHSEHESGEGYAETLQQLKEHPLFAILHVDGPNIEKGDKWPDWCRLANAAARNALNEHDAAKAEKSESKAQGEDTVARVRNRLSAVETERRIKSALINEPIEEKPLADETIEKLRRFDIQQLLIWNGQRAIKDFWLNTVKPNSSAPFFILTATDLFQEASGLLEPRISAVEQQIKRSKPAYSISTTGLPLYAEAQPSQRDEKAAVVSVVVGEGSKPNEYPKGFASVYLFDESQRLPNPPLLARSPANAQEEKPAAQTAFVDVSTITPKGQPFSATLTNTSNYGTSLKAGSFFRGRASAMGFPIPNTTGVSVSYVPWVYEKQSITLNGKRLQRSYIDFILDCSESMKDKTARTGELKSESDQRLKLAKEQLTVMLDDLINRNKQDEEFEEIYLGMRFFGHRITWDGGRMENGMYVNPAFANIAQQLRRDTPSGDIEIARPLGKFDDTSNEAIKKRIADLVPWGETPLYRALKEALADFPSDQPDVGRCIIAITDGENRQMQPDTNKDDVLRMWENHQVPIYILGFDIAGGEKKETEQATREYTEIATKSHGKFLPVNNGTDLLAKLKETLPIDLYTVSDSDRPPTKLSDITPIDKAKLPKEFTVSIRTIKKPVILEGGEAIALYLSDNSQNIEARPYSRDVQPVYLHGGSKDMPLGLRVHRPDKDKDLVRFKLSLQVNPNADHFTARPLETWVEVTPLANSLVAGPTYLFYDVNFEPNEPVPVLKWTAPNWPESSDQARIRFWCKYAHTDPAQTIALRDLLKTRQTVGGVEFFATSSNEGNECSIQIEERHNPQSPVDEFHVRFETDIFDKPKRVIHRFNDKLHTATHTYFFPAELRENIERSEKSRVIVSRSKDRKEGAYQLPPDGLTVKVTEEPSTFNSNAVSTGR